MPKGVKNFKAISRMAKSSKKNFFMFRIGTATVAVAVCAVLGISISTSWAQTWSEPSASPPAGNVAAPIWNQNTAAQTGNFWISGNGYVGGNVGIGTSAPVSKLQVLVPKTASGTTINEVSAYAGTVTISADPSTNNGDKIPLVFNVGNPVSNHVSSVIEAGREAVGWNTYLAFYTNNVTSGPQGVDAIQEKMRITSAGNVGIGTTTPGARLSVAGSDQTSQQVIYRSSDANWNGRIGQIVNGGTIGTLISSGGAWSVSGSTFSATKDYNGGYPTAALFIGNQWNATSQTSFRFARKAAGSTTTDGAVSTLMVIDDSGNVGIGTTSPTQKLTIGDLAAVANVQNNILLVGRQTSNPNGALGSIIFSNSTDTGAKTAEIIADRIGDNFGTSLTFKVNNRSTVNSGAQVTAMSIIDNGNVGIGTTGPGYKLDVNGSINATGGAATALLATSTGAYGVYGTGVTAGVAGISTAGYGVYGSSSGSYAGYFNGTLNATGTITQNGVAVCLADGTNCQAATPPPTTGGANLSTWNNSLFPGGSAGFGGGVVYGNGKYLALAGVGGSTFGSKPTLFTSTDGINWSSYALDIQVSYGVKKISFANGKFFIGAQGYVFMSTNGIAWTRSNYISSCTSSCVFNDVAYGNGVYVTTGKDSNISIIKIFSSTDGITWNGNDAGTAGTINGWHSVVFGGSNIFFAQGFGYYQGYSTGFIATSSDGVNWTASHPNIGTSSLFFPIQPTPINSGFATAYYFYSGSTQCVNFALFNSTGTSLSGGTQNCSASYYTSIDSLGVTTISGTPTVFASLNMGSTGYVYKSTDGLSYSSSVSMGGGNGTGNVSAGGPAVVVLGLTSTLLSYSLNGSAWTTRWFSTGSSFAAGLSASASIAYGANKFVLLFSTGELYWSSDGATWIPALAPATGSGGPVSVAYANGTFLAVSPYYRVFSSDGMNWTKPDANGSYVRQLVSNGTIFVGITTGTPSIVSSTDGTTFTSRITPSCSNGAVGAVAYGNGVFMMACTNSTTLYYSSSTDGISWTAASSFPIPSTQYTIVSNGLAYANGQFVIAVASSSDKKTMLYKTLNSGVLWSSMSRPFVVTQIAGSDMQFVIAASGLIGTVLTPYIYSSDGYSMAAQKAPDEMAGIVALGYGNKTWAAAYSNTAWTGTAFAFSP